MKIILSFFMIPFFLLSQEFSPGTLVELPTPICYNSSVMLSFETLPSGNNNGDYSYNWQKSWNGTNWFYIDAIENPSETSYETDLLNIDTYYRVLVSHNNITLTTNEVIVYVLPELESGVLKEIDTLCINTNSMIQFEIEPFGAELSWGGFADFSYQWQQGIITNIDIGTPAPIEWISIGNDESTYFPDLAEGLYYFRCLVTSTHGCGTVVTDAILVQIMECANSNLTELNSTTKIIKKINILGQTNSNNITLTIYNDGSVDKKLIIK
ncbi:MAG: hypothetical protein CMP49_05320 [Flavobacteriales bacterium]|nr:hypothetical protein [Flavobacteriales bacterium]